MPLHALALDSLEDALRAVPETNAVHNAVNCLHELRRHLHLVRRENPGHAGDPPATSTAGNAGILPATSDPDAGASALPVAGPAPALPPKKAKAKAVESAPPSAREPVAE